MAKDLYCIILKDLGKKPEKVKEELIAYGTSDHDIETIFEKIENNKTVNIAYCQNFKESKLLKERFEGCGATVDVSLSRAKKDKKASKDGSPLYDELCEGFRKYEKKRKELRKNLAFGTIGWPLVAIGICLFAFGNLWGLLPFIPGIVILDVSAFKLMLENNKKKKQAKEDEETPDQPEDKKVWRIILEVLKYIGVILFGAFVVLYRICKNLWQLGSIKRKYHLVMPFNETAGFDILISLAVFAVFLLAAVICIKIAKAIK